MKAWMLMAMWIGMAAQAAESGPVVAIDNASGEAVRAGALVAVNGSPRVLVDRNNVRFEVGPHSVVEFSAEGEFKLLRGTVLASSDTERSLRTSSAKVDFLGRLLVSYDHKEKSTSAFVLAGEARVVNPHESDRTLRLERFRGATMVVGDVVPQLVRQLDFAAVDSWLKGYSWSEARRADVLKELPQAAWSSDRKPAAHLADAKLEDYFSSIDTADEAGQPDYYRRKFADPDQVIAEQNAAKKGASKTMTPEEAALISLPSTRIALDFEMPLQVVSGREKEAELRRIPAQAPTRAIASVPEKKPAARSVIAPRPVKQGDPEVELVLERLRSLKSGNAVFSGPLRRPASATASPVPDPVYDYSENF